ncbi:hypothetical protein EV356DRAFT_514456 [Viridothelium virens]|uniref:DUF1989 domain-containing protein n=1 Tax=Viridothelium virens TaxID=1048519 RepID=A0A6A6HB90_VIRVR|nr:hypothetical protein EV356DRAFT_514456 [Viridothelium virens]
MTIRQREDQKPSPPQSILIPGGHGGALSIPRNSIFRITDLHGQQIVDLLAFRLPSLRERLSVSYTRYQQRGGALAAGDHLYTNNNNPMLRIREDSVRVHDMTFMACNPGFYAEQGLAGHRNCSENLLEGLRAAGVGEELVRDRLELPDPWNVFQNSPEYTLKGGLSTSRAGDYIELEAEMDVLVVGSSCPYDVEGFNGGNATDVMIEIVGRKEGF